MRILKAVWGFIRSFGLFWKDFLVGDSPELALGVIIILGIAYLLHDSSLLDVITITILVLILMIITVWRKTRNHS
jgi:hypothetical protein